MKENLVSDVVWYDDADTLSIATALRKAGIFFRYGVVQILKDKGGN